MTSFTYTVELCDTDVVMLESALKMMIEHSEQKRAEGEGAPPSTSSAPACLG